MNIGIDLDDTLSNLGPYKREFAINYLNNNNIAYTIHNHNGYLFKDIFNWNTQEQDDFWWTCYEELLSTAPSHANAALVTQKLKQQGHHIYIITARSQEYHHQPYQESYDWLQKNQIAFDKLIIGCADKGQVCKEHNIDVFLDDYPPNVETTNQSGVLSVIFNAIHNTDFHNKDIKRVQNWDEFYSLIETISK